MGLRLGLAVVVLRDALEGGEVEHLVRVRLRHRLRLMG